MKLNFVFFYEIYNLNIIFIPLELSLYYLNSKFIGILIKYNYQILIERITWGDCMLKIRNDKVYLESNIEKIIRAIKSKQYDLACEYLHQEMIENDHSAEVYNLLGVISEYKGNVLLAIKYYRAAYVFDPTYKPADKNLEKLTSFFYIFNEESIDYGDTTEKEHHKFHFVNHNFMNIGHLKVTR